MNIQVIAHEKFKAKLG